MLQRTFFTTLIAIGLTGCFGSDFEKARTGSVEALPEPEEEPVESIVPNPSLEASDSEATGWNTAAPDGTATFSVDKTQFFTGENSFKAAITAPADNPWEIEAGPVEIPVVSTTYHYSAWVLGTVGAKANFTASLPAAPWTTFGSQEVTTSGVWKKVSFDFFVPKGVDVIRLPVQMSFAENQGAEIYIDEISLVGDPVEEVPTEKIELPLDDPANWGTDGRPNTLNYDATQGGLVVTPDWSNNDQFAMYTLSEPTNLQNVAITFKVNIPAEYVGSGIYLQPYTQQNGDPWEGDWAGNYNALTEGENTFTYTPTHASAATAGRVGLQVKGSDRTSDPASAIVITEVSWEIEIDNTVQIPLADIGDWSSDGRPNSLAYDASEEALTITPDWSNDDQIAMYTFAEATNLQNIEITYVVNISAEYVGSGIYLQPYTQQNGAPWEGDWAGNYNALTEGENTFTYTPTHASAATAGRIGLQVKGDSRTVDPTSAILIKRISYEKPPEDTSLNIPIEAGLAGWGSDGKSNMLAESGGTLLITPSWTDNDQVAMYTLSEPTNLLDATITFDITVPADYVGTGIFLQPYVQQNGDPWEGDWNGNEQISVEGNTTFTYTPKHASAETAGRVGLQIKGMDRTSDPTSDFVINSIVIEFP